ncbi:MAG: hypothetical protein WD770_09385 [Actinomycetota bacterium]
MRRQAWVLIAAIALVVGIVSIALLADPREAQNPDTPVTGKIIFAAGGPGMVRVSGDTFLPSGLHLVELSLPDGRKRDLTSGPGFDSDPAVSPDGEYVVFSRTATDRDSLDPRLYLFERDSGTTTPLSTCDPCGPQGSATWRPDAGAVAFVGSSGMSIVEVADREMRPLPLPRNLTAITHPSWSPDGQQLAFAALSPPAGGSRIYVLDLRTEQVRPVTSCPEGCAAHLDPSWSPSGDEIAFTLVREPGETGSVAVVSSDGKGMRVLDTCGGPPCRHEHAPSWSPDGKALVFVRDDDLFLFDMAAVTTRRLTDTDSLECCPSWAP